MNSALFFTTTLSCVAIMLLYSVPGFAVVKGKLVKPEAIAAFATVLMYVCQPALTIYTFTRTDFDKTTAIRCLIFIGIVFVVLSLFLGIFYFAFRKKFEDEKYRIYTIATTFSNCTFMGVPLLEKLFPNNPEAVMYSISFFIAMTVLVWSVGSYIISGDKKYVSPKRIFLNPCMISVYVAVPIWISGFRFPEMLDGFFTILGRMTTPMCMLVLGMRLATVSFKDVFANAKQYVIIAINQLLLPLFAFVLVFFLPVDSLVKQSLVILMATPVASVVLNFAEMIGKGQKTAANCVLLGTMLSLLSLPLVSLLLNCL